MALSGREIRHIALVTLIIAALPMLVFPRSLGFEFEIALFFYVVLELLYFTVVSWVRNAKMEVRARFTAAGFYLIGRLLLSFVLFIYMLMMESIGTGAAWTAAFGSYKPAMLLFSLTTPFLYGATIQSILGHKSRRGKVRRVRPAARQIITSDSQRMPSQASLSGYRPAEREAPDTASSSSSQEYLTRSFDDAVQHVGDYSGVLCAMLLDAEGLPVAGWSRGQFNPEDWAALARLLIDQVNDTCSRGGGEQVEMLEFRSGHQRFYLYRVSDMWLMSIADAASDELEKIRVHQAAEMIARRCNERYAHVYMTEAGRSYAGSTV
jgi:predicted regulator of Ras-like GTPase activity (Roadblock/LC7/MglB family)